MHVLCVSLHYGIAACLCCFCLFRFAFRFLFGFYRSQDRRYEPRVRALPFLEAPRAAGEMRQYCDAVPGPKMANLLAGGLTPALPPPVARRPPRRAPPRPPARPRPWFGELV